MRTTRHERKEDAQIEWFLADADGAILGRLAVRVARVLRGKHRPLYSPHVAGGGHVVVVNASKVALTGRKREQHEYVSYSGFPGGQKHVPFATMLQKRPDEVIRRTVRGMLPKNTLGRAMMRKLKVYAGAEHPHQAQQPKPLP